MEFIPTEIPGVTEVRLRVHADERGRFKRHYCEREFAAAGLATRFAQVNHSIATRRGAVRGFHYQAPPAAEDKLISCTLGRVFDVAVDLRRGSPTFLRWTSVELDDATMIYIPKGCAHGFQTLTDEAHLVYLHSDFYSPDLECGVSVEDPALGVRWPLAIATLSDRDRSFPPIGATFEGVTL